MLYVIELNLSQEHAGAHAFIIIIGGPADLAIVTDSPASITVNERETATFDCNVTGVGDLSIEWDVGGDLYNSVTCSDTCSSINSESGDGYITSTLEITAVTDLDIRCIVYQILIFLSEDPSVEIRLPPTRKAKNGTTVHVGKNQNIYYDSLYS